MVQGALFVPGFARAHCHGDGTPIRPGTSGTKTVADVPPGVSRYPVSRLICGRASSAGSGSREPAYPACRTLAQRYGVNRDTLAGRRPGRPAGRRLGGNGGKMSTFQCGRSSTTGLSPPVHCRYRSPARRSAGPYRLDGLACRPLSWDSQARSGRLRGLVSRVRLRFRRSRVASSPALGLAGLTRVPSRLPRQACSRRSRHGVNLLRWAMDIGGSSLLSVRAEARVVQ